MRELEETAQGCSGKKKTWKKAGKKKPLVVVAKETSETTLFHYTAEWLWQQL